MNYDKGNIFAKILRDEIPCKKIYEDEFILSFHDINPQKKIHALVISKGQYVDLDDFSANASSEEMVGLLKGINIVAQKLGISTEVGKGYRAPRARLLPRRRRRRRESLAPVDKTHVPSV